MLLENLRYYKEVSNLTYEQLSEESKTPLSTIKNIFSGKNEPLASTLHRISKALKVSLEDLLADANVVLASQSIIEVQETLEEVKVTLAETEENLAEAKESANIIESERDIIKIENKRLKTENERLTNENNNLNTELRLLKQEIQHKDELLELHKFYRKLIPNN
jgi:transcriptional regulator with XRE-family HTH domain